MTQLASNRLHNAPMTLQIVCMAQDDKDPPQAPFGAKSFNEAMEAQDAEDQKAAQLQLAQQRSKHLAPTYSNYVYVEPTGRSLRMSFGEIIGGEPVFHTSVVMPLEDAYQTGELLVRLSTAGITSMLDNMKALVAGLDAPEEKNG